MEIAHHVLGWELVVLELVVTVVGGLHVRGVLRISYPGLIVLILVLSVRVVYQLRIYVLLRMMGLVGPV